MNQNVINDMVKKLGITEDKILSVLDMLKEGNTIPFIAGYRKSATGGLDAENIKEINEVYEYENNLFKRKEDVIRLIEEKDLMTPELKEKILSCTKLVEVEDLYRPYKEKKKTKATEAIKNGLEPLAKMIMSFPLEGSLDKLCEKFINDKVKTKEEALTGAGYIIAEYISDNAYYRKWIRSFIYKEGIIVSKLKKDAKDEKKVYELYYDYREAVKEIKPHRTLAINRAEKEKVISVSIEVEQEKIISFLEEKVIKNDKSFVTSLVKDAIKDSLKRLIYPSVEREVRSELSLEAEKRAIENFSHNLENLLMQMPMKDKTVLAFDPGYVNGCKLAVIDKTGKYLTSTVIKPFASSDKQLEDSKRVLLMLIKKYNVDIIAIGNGTASRESEKLCANLIKENNLDCKYIIVNEAGASVYSTEKVAAEEFPDLSPNERSAISIGRRLQDPLAELVKVPPMAVGVGLYQHDVTEKLLKEKLDFVVEKVVNDVGVNINTASPSLLRYVSGITKPSIDKIINYRNQNGKFLSREELKEKKILSDKAYEQAIGFMRIIDGENKLDRTDIHPESYDITKKLLSMIKLNVQDIGTNIEDALNKVNVKEYAEKLNTDTFTIEDIISSLKKPNRDPRDEMPAPILKSDVLELKDLKKGMSLEGTVRNVVDFGAFIDIGLHNDGLVHISKISKGYVKHPSDYLSVGDIVKVYVHDIDLEKEKVSLSMFE